MRLLTIRFMNKPKITVFFTMLLLAGLVFRPTIVNALEVNPELIDEIFDNIITIFPENENQPGSNMTIHTAESGSPIKKHDLGKYYTAQDELTDHADFDITGHMTIETLVYMAAAPGGGFGFYLIDKYDGSGGYLLSINPSLKVQLRLSSTAISTCDTVLSALTWYRIKVVYDASAQEVTWYINGSSAPATVTGTIPASIGTNSTDVHIGTNYLASTAFFNGLIAC